MAQQTIAILDFGSQYVQLIARRVRENQVHSLIFAPDVSPAQLQKNNVVGIILSGGPASTYAAKAPKPQAGIFEMGLPVLGICYGMQVACQLLGAKVAAAGHREYGRTKLEVVGDDPLLAHLPRATTVWMSHGDWVTDFGDEFASVARTPSCPHAVVRHRRRPLWGVQFHPEVTHTPEGGQILRNFLYDLCKAEGSWNAGSIIDQSVEAIRAKVRPGSQVICGLSGGVDSAVTAALVHKAVPDRLTCIFVDNGLLRANERDRVEAIFRGHFRLELRVINAAERFLRRLAGVTDPQEKRIRIGHEFIEVFKEEAKRIPSAHYLAQGTLYPDVIESGHSAAGTTASIKLHHNVGGLPAELGFELIEPLRDLFKDEARVIGEVLGLPEEMIWRHPFPGPGLAVRIIGEVTRERCDLLRQADQIITEEIVASGWHRKVAQAFGVLMPVSSVGVMGDGRAYAGQQAVAVRLVESTDFMTADWVHIDPGILSRISTRITNEVPGINRVVYDITSKPPGTIEWEQAMIYSTGCEYGIRAMMNMAREAPDGRFLLLRRIVGGEDLPSHFVGKVLQVLVRKGILLSVKGRGGGYALERPPEKITLRHIVDALDGAERNQRCILGFSPCDSTQQCPQHDEWVRVREQIERLLDQTTLADLVREQDRKRARSGRMAARRK